MRKRAKMIIIMEQKMAGVKATLGGQTLTLDGRAREDRELKHPSHPTAKLSRGNSNIANGDILCQRGKSSLYT